MTLVYRLAKLLAVNDIERLPAEVDAIALVSIGSTRFGLSFGTCATIEMALRLFWKYPQAQVIYGAFAGNDEHINSEEETKRSIFKDRGIYAGKVWTTISECLAFKEKFPNARQVIFVTEEAHSRRAKIVWKCLWPEAEIYIVPVKLEEAIDSRSCMATYHNPWKALFLQVAPIPIYKFMAMLGPEALKLLGNLHQPTAH